MVLCSDINTFSDMMFKSFLSNLWALFFVKSFGESVSFIFQMIDVLFWKETPSNGYDNAAFWTPALCWYFSNVYFYIVFVLSS